MSVDPGGSNPEAHSWWIAQYCTGEDRGSTGLYQGPAKQESGKVFLVHYSYVKYVVKYYIFNTLNICWLELVSSRLVTGWSASSRATHPCASWAVDLVGKMLLWGPPGTHKGSVHPGWCSRPWEEASDALGRDARKIGASRLKTWKEIIC